MIYLNLIYEMPNENAFSPNGKLMKGIPNGLEKK